MIFVGLAAGCASRPQHFNNLKEGQWEARVTVDDKVKKKNISLTVSFKAVPLDQLRMDILTPTGIYVGSVAVSGDQFQALMARDKKFYRGPATSGSMSKVINVPLNPHWLNHFLFDVPPEGWDCRFNDQKYLESCTNAAQKFEVVWSQRQKNRKMIQIKSPNFSVEIFLSRFFPVVEGKSEAFHLEPPKGFRIFRIR